VLALPRGRVFVAVEPADLRRSYDGLAAMVSGAFGRDVFEGDAFVFLNRRATQVRVLYWDRDGYCLWMKRLEAGTFRRLSGARGQALLEVDAGELAMLLSGIDAPVVKRRKRYVRPQKIDTVRGEMHSHS
jgi:transposase